MEQEAFFLVWRPQGHAPTYKHPTRESVINEAERLARDNPGREFYVLQAIEGRCVNDMQRVKLPAIPF